MTKERKDAYLQMLGQQVVRYLTDERFSNLDPHDIIERIQNDAIDIGLIVVNEDDELKEVK